MMLLSPVWLSVLLVQVFVLFDPARGEYHIRDTTSYLYKKFETVEEDTFPKDIQINMSLSRIRGTLLYSIDRHRNQLIMVLGEGMSPKLEIIFRGQRFHESLSKLCGCAQCRHEGLVLRIQLNKSIHLQCNNRLMQTIDYTDKWELNNEYPILFTEAEFSTASPNVAHLWLVNTQELGNVTSNSDQLLGCIFNVTYNNQQIDFSNATENIGNVCIKICTGNICNGGDCYETYRNYPRCNCTRTFMNGYLCNDKIESINKKSINKTFHCAKLKLSWKSSTNEILILEQLKTRLLLYRVHSILYFCIHMILEDSKTCVLYEYYVENKEYILTASFYEREILINIFNGTSWHAQHLLTNEAVGDNATNSITLRSGNGIIDIACKKSHEDIKWKILNISTYEVIAEENLACMDNFNLQRATKYLVWIAFVLLGFIVGCITGHYGIYKPWLIIKEKLYKKDSYSPIEKIIYINTFF